MSAVASRLAPRLAPSTIRRPPPERHRARAPLGAAPESADAREHPWISDVRTNSPLLSDVRFVLCNPQGPANVGACARVMQNFGIYDLKLCDVGPFVLRSDEARETLDEASEGEGRSPERASTEMGATAATTAPLSEEAALSESSSAEG